MEREYLIGTGSLRIRFHTPRTTALIRVQNFPRFTIVERERSLAASSTVRGSISFARRILNGTIDECHGKHHTILSSLKSRPLACWPYFGWLLVHTWLLVKTLAGKFVSLGLQWLIVREVARWIFRNSRQWNRASDSSMRITQCEEAEPRNEASPCDRQHVKGVPIVR